MNLNQLKIFYVAAMRGNLNIAAKDLFVTQPAVTKGIQRLQDHYDIKLVNRFGKKLALTDAGHALFEIAEKIFDLESLAEETIREFQQSKRGRIRILASESFGAYYLPSPMTPVIEAIHEQMKRLSFCTRRYTNKTAVDLARKLAALAPGNLNKILLCPGGAEAIGIAVKLARVVTGRHKTVSMWDSFHGATLYTISVGGEAIFRQDIGPLMPGTEHVPPPDEYHCAFECFKRGGCDLMCARYLDYVLEKEGDIAAVIAEPIRTTPYIPRPEYWRIIRESCDRHGTLLIFDEIPHALGRTGRMFTCENFDVIPDMIVIGKGLGGGIFPLAALIAREELDIASERALGHYTHEKALSPVRLRWPPLNLLKLTSLPAMPSNSGFTPLNV